MDPQPDPLERERRRSALIAGLAVWVVLGIALSLVWWASWAQSAGLKHLVGLVQHEVYPTASPPFALRVDGWLHALVSAATTGWLILGCRILRPNVVGWLPPMAAACIALSDELLQIGSATRSFEWSDQVWDLIGILLVWPAAFVFTGPGSADGKTP